MLSNSGSLRARLAALFGIVLLVGGALVLFATSNFATQAADEAYDKLLASAALTAMENLSVKDKKIDFDLPYASLDTLSLSENDRVTYRLKSESKGLLTGYDGLLSQIPKPWLRILQKENPTFLPHLTKVKTFVLLCWSAYWLNRACRKKSGCKWGKAV